MAHDLESALAACEALLRQGASLEECLERFPEHREALEPLLPIYQVFRSTWDETPPPSKEGLQRARTRFLAEAARLREAEEAPSQWSRLFEGLISLTTSRGLAIAAYVLVFFTVAVTVTAVAQGALPGDPLYPVKRHSEDVVMFLDKSEVLRERFDQRRLDEVEMLTERAPDQKITISGEVDRVEGLSFRVGGVPVQVPQEMRDRIPAEGARVQVVGVPREDHILLIEAPLVKATPPRSTPQTIMIVAPATATPTATPTATAMPSKTATATITASVTASATATPEATIAPARTDMPTATATATHTATATQTVTPTSTMTHTPVPTETHTPQPPPRPITVRIEGCIQQLEAERWRVEGRWVQVPANRFSLERASAVVGGGVVIRAVERPDGRLEAEAIAIQDPQLREFNGAIEEIAQDYWRVAGRIVHIDVATEVIGERILGVRAQVAADEYCDGRLRARRISIVAEPEILMGRVLSIAGDHWVLARSDKPDGQRVSFNQATEVHGEVVVGATVQVTAVKLADGSLLARSLHVLAGPPPTRTPTAVPPTATSTPTEDVATSTPEVKGDSNQDLVEPTPSPVLDTATAEPTAQPSSTDDLQDAALDPTPSTRDKSQAESDAAVMAEAEGDEIEASPAPALCPTPMPGA